MAPNIDPIAAAPTVMISNLPQGITPRCEALDSVLGGGSVLVCSASPTEPIVPSTSATSRPLCGAIAVAMMVTSVGPTTKTISSPIASMAKAVCRSGSPWRRLAHRARISEPTWGRAMPAKPAVR